MAILESEIQEAVVRLLERERSARAVAGVADLRFSHPIQNAQLPKTVRFRLWRQGVRPGLVDLVLADLADNRAGLLELKRPGETATAEQMAFLSAFGASGVKVGVEDSIEGAAAWLRRWEFVRCV